MTITIKGHSVTTLNDHVLGLSCLVMGPPVTPIMLGSSQLGIGNTYIINNVGHSAHEVLVYLQPKKHLKAILKHITDK